ncbi:hypothetical protein BKP45_19035 [Anaerobacillus alkalidiazotrophicus]|uniref:Sulfotransferase family protein n=1 Tax=Anaerobacillus alkalidiazotrophicus TaxID=472963 RepID=A0A1S2M205_9BACI|nr:sulfotransferase family 2 domain-containing protein [Anaerobacillus alkalidiazotrophicus]OIJ18540.1 hypothetical protein BKP45_19035 [Anaerobacillus alkalidiazotrophicus]
MKNKEILIHLHMPKTAGTTLKYIIGKNIDRNSNFHVYKADPERDAILKQLTKKNVACIQGHFPFGVHHYFSSPSTYITMLREPAERIISEYYFIRSIRTHDQFEKVMNMSLEEYHNQNEHMNLQTRLISGYLGDQLTTAHLEQAKQHIENYFSVVGLTEMFDQSLYLMKKFFNWQTIDYRKQNITKNKPQIHQLPKKTIESIKENNQLDNELYHFSKLRLLKQLNSFFR